MPHYSARLLDHFYAPRNGGAMIDPDVIGKGSLDGRAPYLELYLRFDGEIVSAANFTTFGCAAAIACGSAMTELVIGRSSDHCARIDERALIETLDGIPQEKAFCASLAVCALRDAVAKHGSPTSASPETPSLNPEHG